jgi:preprotein translocase subunit SecE
MKYRSSGKGSFLPAGIYTVQSNGENLMAEKTGLAKRISRYLREVRQETKKVTWPSREELISSTIVVLMTVAFFILLIGGLDFVFAQLVRVVAFRS